MTQPDSRTEPVSEEALDLAEELRDAHIRPGLNIQEIGHWLSEVRFSVDSDDRSVRVHMTAAGLLDRIEFRNDALHRHNERTLAKVVQSTVGQAEEIAKTAVEIATMSKGKD